MDALTLVILFIFGLAVGSFLNVLALRYREDKFSFDPKVIGGRSHCPHCGRTLRWFELFPIASFIVQGGRCRRCKARIGWQYPLVELLSGMIFVCVPLRLEAAAGGFALSSPVLVAFWIAALELLLLVTYIDIRLQLVPDELTVLLDAVAVFIAIFSAGSSNGANISLLAPYAGYFGLQDNIWTNRLAAAVGASAFFVFLILATRGKGMGWGDAKLAFALGLLFGWPDVMALIALAFVSGAIVGGGLLVSRRRSMKSAVPFVPFLAFGAAFVFFYGAPALGAYFHIIGI